MGRNRNIHIQLWLNGSEVDHLNHSVEKSGLSREAYLRHLINGLIPQDKPPPDYYGMMRELHRIGNNMNQLAVKAHSFGYINASWYRENFKQLCSAIETITNAVLLPREIPDSPRKDP